jgi:Uma2 family endonuclease
MQLKIKKFTVEQYEQMAKIGFLQADERVELLGGNIIYMSPIGIKHAGCVSFLTRFLWHHLIDQAVIWPQNPVILDNYSEPEPDIAVLQKETNSYRRRKPTAEDVLLLIEVADSTLEKDRNIKIPLYAKNNIQEVWLVDISNNIVEVYRSPVDETYTNIKNFLPGDYLSMIAFPEISISVDEILDYDR